MLCDRCHRNRQCGLTLTENRAQSLAVIQFNKNAAILTLCQVVNFSFECQRVVFSFYRKNTNTTGTDTATLLKGNNSQDLATIPGLDLDLATIFL